MISAILAFGISLQAPAKAVGGQAPVPAQVNVNQQIKAPPPRVQDLPIPPKVALPAGASSPDISGPLTADEAARIALLREPSIRKAFALVEAARGVLQQVASAINPQVFVSVGANTISSLSGSGVRPNQFPVGTTPAGVSPVDHLNSAVELRQLLFDFNQTRSLIRENRALIHAAESNFTRAEQDLALNVKNAYYNFAGAESLLAVNDQNVANRQRQLDLANARLTNGIGQPSDVVTAETSKSQALVALSQARDQVEQTRVSLLLTMGLNPLTPISTVQQTEAGVGLGDPQALIAQAVQNRPEVKQARFNLFAAQNGLSAARSLNLPSIYATGVIGSAGNQTPLNTSVTGVAIGLNFPILDGGQRSGAIETAKGQTAGAEADLQTIVNLVQADVASAYAALLSVEQRVALVNSEVTNAREGVRLAEGRYKEGFGSFLDIITAQNLLLGALTDQTNVVSALNLARTRVKHALGSTLTR